MICRNLLPVYLFIFQLHLLFFAATTFMVNKDYQDYQNRAICIMQ